MFYVGNCALCLTVVAQPSRGYCIYIIISIFTAYCILSEKRCFFFLKLGVCCYLKQGAFRQDVDLLGCFPQLAFCGQSQIFFAWFQCSPGAQRASSSTPLLHLLGTGEGNHVLMGRWRNLYMRRCTN